MAANGEGRRRQRVLPLVITVSLVAATAYVARTLNGLEVAQVQRATRLAVVDASREISKGAHSRIQALVRISRRLGARQHLDIGSWKEEARVHLADFGGYYALALLDSSLTLRDALGAGGGPLPIELAPVIPAATLSRQSGQPLLSSLFELPDGTRAVAAVIPVIREGAFEGCIAGVLSLPVLLEQAAVDVPGYSVGLSAGGQSILSQAEGGDASPVWILTEPVRIYNALWTVRCWPGHRLISEQRTAAPLAVWISGLALAIIGGLAAWLGQTASRRARLAVEERTAELARSNAELRTEMAERARTEETLRASEARYREVCDNANDLIYIHDLNGKFLATNKAAQALTGYTEQEALQLKLADVLAPEDLLLAREMISRKLGGEGATTYEICIVTKSGKRVMLEVSSHLVYRGGFPFAIEGVARDITERKRLEEQLRQSQKMEAIGRLAGGLAHDFNNLLTVIAAYTQMIGEEPDAPAQVRTYAEEVLALVERASTLTARLLAFSRRQKLQQEIVDVNALLTGMENMLRRLIGEDIEMNIAIEPGLGKINADPGQIEQILMNLAVNARDAMPRGGRLAIRAADYTVSGNGAGAIRPGRYVRLEVSDTGVGIPPEVQSLVFEPFFTTKEPGKGTGLGLSTVYGIVRQSGGEIRLESEPGKGTTFTILLPVIDEERPLRQSTELPLIYSRGTGREPTVLLAEDDPAVRKLVEKMLAGRGYRVLGAASAKEALQLAESDADFDLLLTDIVMPQMSGCELAEALRARRPGLKVLFMTGYSDEAIVAHGASREAQILKKPFRAEALDRTIRQIVGSQFIQ